MKPIKQTKEDVSKHIMPNRCDMCSIGIGTSMLFYENTWRPFKHVETKTCVYYWSGGRVVLCEDCYNKVINSKNPEQYLYRNLYASRTKYGKEKTTLQIA